MGNEMEDTLPKERSTKGQSIHEKMFDILSHQGSANQNYIESLPHPI
jgi:hypothetical protein